MKPKIYYIADMFAEDYIGGAELTTKAIMQACKNYKVEKIHSHKLTLEVLENNKQNHFIVCNFSNLDDKNKIYMCKNNHYSIIEYDYKFCKYRSTVKHKQAEGIECNCIEQIHGKINSAFYGYASKIWFMSQEQKNIFIDNVVTIKKENCSVLSSIFSDGDLRFIQSLKDNEKNDKYLILDSNSWIKNTTGCIEYAIRNNLSYELIKNLPYHELLIKMSTSRGLIFMPTAPDTCPRFVIEGKLLGLKLHLNNFVQHKDESWFLNSERTYEYLNKRVEYFWSFYE